MDRRPLKTRAARWPHQVAEGLVRIGLTPNQVSVLSVGFSLLGAVCFAIASPVTLLLAAGMIQLRLVCNLLDGLMAVEGGLKTPTGDLYNEVPDRVADSVFLVAAGYVVPEYAWIGWTAAVLAVSVAYARVLGASLLQNHDFTGLMAKPQRMFALTVGSLAAAAELAWLDSQWVLPVTLGLIAIGSLGTFIGRVRRVAAALESR